MWQVITLIAALIFIGSLVVDSVVRFRLYKVEKQRLETAVKAFESQKMYQNEMLDIADSAKAHGVVVIEIK